MKRLLTTPFIPFILLFILSCKAEPPTPPPSPGGERPPAPVEGAPAPTTEEPGAPGIEERPPEPGEIKMEYTQEELEKSGNFVKIMGRIKSRRAKEYADKDLFIDVIIGKPIMDPEKADKSERALKLLTRKVVKFGETFSVLVPKDAGEITLNTIIDVDGNGPFKGDPAGFKILKVKSSNITNLTVSIKEPPKDVVLELTPPTPPSPPSPPERAVEEKPEEKKAPEAVSPPEKPKKEE